MRSDIVTKVVGRRPRSRSLTQQLGDNLSESIRSGTLRPGDRLPPEAEMVVQEGVSRTVVREAISRLQAGGLVETRHGVGTFVLAPADPLDFKMDATALGTIQDVLAMLELRISLESQAAGLAAARRSAEHLAAMHRALNAYEETIASGGDTIRPDFDFHLQIAHATGNRYFEDVMSQLGTKTIPRARIRVPTGDLTGYLRRVHGQHEAVYRAILARDPEAAQTMMRVHLTASREELVRLSGESGVAQ